MVWGFTCGCWFQGFGLVVFGTPKTTLPGTALSEPPFRGPPFPWTAQNFTLLFPLPPSFSFFSSLSGGLLVEFWSCLKRRDPLLCTFGLSGCRVKPRRQHNTPTTHNTQNTQHTQPHNTHNTHKNTHTQTQHSREPKRAHLRVPAFKNTTKIPREDIQRKTQRTKMAAGEGKKSKILGGPEEEGPAEGVQGRPKNLEHTQQHTHTNTHTDVVFLSPPCLLILSRFRSFCPGAFFLSHYRSHVSAVSVTTISSFMLC